MSRKNCAYIFVILVTSVFLIYILKDSQSQINDLDQEVSIVIPDENQRQVFKPKSIDKRDKKFTEVLNTASTVLSDDATLSHISLVPLYSTNVLYGLGVKLKSDHYSLSDFGFNEGDYITHVDDVSIIDSEESFNLEIKKHIQYGVAFVRVNRNNNLIDLEIELE